MSFEDKLRKRRTVPITTFLVLAFGGLAALGLVGQIVVGLLSARENTAELIRDKAQITIDGIESRVHSILDPVVAQGQAMGALAGGGPILADPRINPFFAGSLAATPQVQSIWLIIPGKMGREFRRTTDGFAIVDREFDAGARRTVEDVQQAGSSLWGEPKLVDGVVILPQYTILLNDAGAMHAVLVQMVSGDALSRALGAVALNVELQMPFILYGESGVLAHPLLAANRMNFPAQPERMPTAAEIGDEVLSNIWKANEIKWINLANSTNDVVKGMSVGGNVYMFAFRSIEGYSDKPWIVGAYFDGARTRTQMRRLVFIGLSGFFILIFVTALAFVIGRRTSKPASRLARAAQLVHEGKLDQITTLEPTVLRELDEASASFNSMVVGLRESKVIRDLFGKFVPERVAAEMLRSPEGLAPQSGDATILFVDVADFTALAEEVGPVAIVNILNAYFAELVAIIEAEDGIVTQFQGDAILAVFNVPRAVPGHARQAVKAARAISWLVKKKDFGGHHLCCRIGIATGAVVAGNVGAPGRMNYTVHGDAVNLAARLEQLNKEFGTDILIAESTVREIDGVDFRRIGAVDVRGHSAQVTLYTLALE